MSIYADTFEGYVATSDLDAQGHWTTDRSGTHTTGIFTVFNSGNAFSGSKTITPDQSGNFNVAYISDLDGNGGDAQAFIHFYLHLKDSNSYVYVYTRVTTTPPDTGTGYFALANFNSGLLGIYKRVSGTSTLLSGTVSLANVVTGKWYRLTCYAQGANPTNLKCEVYNATDNTYMQTDGTFGASQAYCVTYTETTSSVTGQGKAAFEASQSAVFDIELDSFSYDPVIASSFSISPSTVPNNSSNQTLTLTGTGTAWVQGTTIFTLSGTGGSQATGAAATKVSQNITSATAATVVVTTGPDVGTLTVTENITGSSTATTQVTGMAPSPYQVPTSNANYYITVRLIGDGTNWDGTTVFNISGVSGVTKIGQLVVSQTYAEIYLTTGATVGTLTFTETVTGNATAQIAVGVSGGGGHVQMRVFTGY